LEGVLGDRAAELTGIVNGIDMAEWNPARDTLLPAVYDADNLDKKSACRAALRARMELPENGSVVVGLIGRLVEQKGFDLIATALDELLRRDIQLVILGTGTEQYQTLLQEMKAAHPEKVSIAFAFDNSLAHLIEAGADLYLMPSRYEPCGLNQLYSLRYGTPPLVHAIGGLADTVIDATPATLSAGTATGFSFVDYTPAALLETLDRALALFHHEPATWRQIQRAGMAQDWSWGASAAKYLSVFKAARAKKRG
jgi:starch synthase